jgi:membrane-associated phospholipid phosphatase
LFALFALTTVLRWPLAGLAFFAYLALMAEFQPRVSARARIRVWAGAALGAAGAIAALRLPADAVANVWILPPALLLLGYWTSGLLFVEPMPAAERRLVAIDRALRIQAIASHAPRVAAEALELAYVGIYPLILAALWIAIPLGITAERFWTVLLVIDFICFGVLPWVQTRPPRALGIDAPWRSAWRRINLRIVESSSVKVNTFPSGHAAEALAAALLLVAAPWPIVALMFAAALAVSAGAVLGRYHYAADAIAGWAVALLIWGIA